jgi:hypothetical protein
MEMNTKLKLDRNRKRVRTCPCGKSNKDLKFVPFVGYEDKGYCHSCNQTFLPEKENFFRPQVKTKPVERPKTTYLDKKLLSNYFKSENLNENNFYVFLKSLLGEERADVIRYAYFLGQTKRGATVFPLIDEKARIRSGKIMQYKLLDDKTVAGGLNAKRDKDGKIGWIHSALKIKGFVFEKCLFGLHLILDFPKRKIAVVESEKTAMICSVYMPDFTWMAIGGKGLNIRNFEPIRQFPIMLFPDLNATEEWKETAHLWKGKFNITVSDYLESVATEQQKKDGLDIADFLIGNHPVTTIGPNRNKADTTALSKLRELNQSNTVPDEHLQLLIDEMGLSC